MKLISVPLTREAMERLDTDSCIDGDLEELELSNEDYEELWGSGLFEQLNEKLDIIIDDYEDEVISNEKLSDALIILESYSERQLRCIKEIRMLINCAIESKTAVFLFF